VHPGVGDVFPVHVPVMQVVDVVGVHHGLVPAARAVGVPMLLGLLVFGRCHRFVLSAVSFHLNGRMRIHASQHGTVTAQPME
jgi:hypothetical protein